MFLGLPDPDLLQKVPNNQKIFDENMHDLDQHPDPLVRGMDPRIRIRTKISWIRNTVPHLFRRYSRVRSGAIPAHFPA